MQQNSFSQPVSHDFVPRGSRCEWCGKEAVEQLTAIGGRHHNQGGRFCSSCASAFIQQVSSHATTPVALSRNSIPELSSFYPLANEPKLANRLSSEEAAVTSRQSVWLCLLN